MNIKMKLNFYIFLFKINSVAIVKFILIIFFIHVVYKNFLKQHIINVSIN